MSKPYRANFPSGKWNKPVILLIPHYMGSLRYFEKLIPLLADKYEVCFLLFAAHTASFGEMEAYCIQKSYFYIAIDEAIKNPFIDHFPLVAYLRNVTHYKQGILSMLQDFKISKMISPNDNGLYIRLLFKEAQKKAIDTMVLQWALAYHGQKDRPLRKKNAIRKKIYYLRKRLYLFLKRFLLIFILGKEYNIDKGIMGGGASLRFGVINQQAFDYFLDNGVPKEKMTIVGSLEFALTESMRQALESDEKKIEFIVNKYGINRLKRNILLFSSPFNLKDVTIFSDTEQYEYTRHLISIIQEVCPSDQFDILFKIHPAEDILLYRPLEKKGIKIYDKSAINQELIFISDLYIGDNTNTNFITILMNKDAIFINLMHLDLVEKSKKYFGIHKFVESEEEFKNLLKNFRASSLEPQYEKRDDIFTPDSLSRIKMWIG